MIETPSHSNIGDWRGFLFCDLNGKTGFKPFDLVGVQIVLILKKSGLHVHWLVVPGKAALREPQSS